MVKKVAAKKEPKLKFDKFSTYKGDVDSALSDAYSMIQDLGSEFREICDNTSENLQQSDLYNRRDETASACEGLSEPSVNSSILGDLEVDASQDNGKVYRGRQNQSRACRAGNAAAIFTACAETVQQWVEENPPLKKRIKESKASYGSVKEFEEAHEEAQELIDACEEIANEIENMEWPGMFG